jgi:hypothetical protein
MIAAVDAASKSPPQGAVEKNMLGVGLAGKFARGVCHAPQTGRKLSPEFSAPHLGHPTRSGLIHGFSSEQQQRKPAEFQ